MKYRELHYTNYNHSTISYDGMHYAYDALLILFSAFYKELNKYHLNINKYFFNNNHLGSSSWITDASGSANQHLQYLPYGEDYIYQRNFDWDVPYTFSGKEKDVETGYSFPTTIEIGARYYDSNVSVWLSVDTLVK